MLTLAEFGLSQVEIARLRVEPAKVGLRHVGLVLGVRDGVLLGRDVAVHHLANFLGCPVWPPGHARLSAA